MFPYVDKVEHLDFKCRSHNQIKLWKCSPRGHCASQNVNLAYSWLENQWNKIFSINIGKQTRYMKVHFTRRKQNATWKKVTVIHKSPTRSTKTTNPEIPFRSKTVKHSKETNHKWIKESEILIRWINELNCSDCWCTGNASLTYFVCFFLTHIILRPTQQQTPNTQ